jgi:hypothetical protein
MTHAILSTPGGMGLLLACMHRFRRISGIVSGRDSLATDALSEISRKPRHAAREFPLMSLKI